MLTIIFFWFSGQKFALIEEKTVLCSVLRNFKVEAVEDNISILQELTTKPANGLQVKLMPRNKNWCFSFDLYFIGPTAEFYSHDNFLEPGIVLIFKSYNNYVF